MALRSLTQRRGRQHMERLRVESRSGTMPAITFTDLLAWSYDQYLLTYHVGRAAGLAYRRRRRHRLWPKRLVLAAHEHRAAPCCLELRQQTLCLEQLNDDGVAEAKSRRREVLATECAEQFVVTAAAEDRPKLAGAIKPFEDRACECEARERGLSVGGWAADGASDARCLERP